MAYPKANPGNASPDTSPRIPAAVTGAGQFVFADQYGRPQQTGAPGNGNSPVWNSTTKTWDFSTITGLIAGASDGQMLYWNNTTKLWTLTNAPSNGQVPQYSDSEKIIKFVDSNGMYSAWDTPTDNINFFPNRTFINNTTNPIGKWIETSYVQDGDQINAWYRNTDDNLLYYAYSTDPLCQVWTIGNNGNPLVIGAGYSYFNYVFKVGSTYYMAIQGLGLNTYLYTSTDKITWVIGNSGNPIVTHSSTPADWNYHLFNPSIAVNGSTWYLLIEGSSDVSDFVLGYSYGTFDGTNINFNTNLSANPVLGPTGSCPFLVYVPEKSALLTLYSDRFDTQGYIIAATGLIADNLALAANWHASSGFSVVRDLIDLSDPTLVFNTGTHFDFKVMLGYNYNQQDGYQAYGQMTLTQLYNLVTSGDNIIGPSLSITRNLRVVGTASAASMTVTGVYKSGNGTAAAPDYTFTSETNLGMYRAATGVIGFSSGSRAMLIVYNLVAAGLTTTSDSIFAWSSTTAATGTADTGFSRTGAGALALGNGTGNDASGTLALASMALSATNPLLLGAVFSFAQDANTGYIGANFNQGTGGKYIKNQPALQLAFDSSGGAIVLRGAAAGTIGAAIAYTNIMTLTTADMVVNARNIYPIADNTYYLGKNSSSGPFAWKGIIVRDTVTGNYYRIETISGVLTATLI